MDDAEKELLIDELAKALESDLMGKHGPTMTGEDLLRALGYTSKDGLRQSVVKKTVPVPLFNMEHRRGKFSLVKEVARYLAEQRYNAKFGTSLDRNSEADQS